MATPSLALIDDPCLYLIYKYRKPVIADGVVCVRFYREMNSDSQGL